MKIKTNGSHYLYRPSILKFLGGSLEATLYGDILGTFLLIFACVCVCMDNEC